MLMKIIQVLLLVEATGLIWARQGQAQTGGLSVPSWYNPGNPVRAGAREGKHTFSTSFSQIPQVIVTYESGSGGGGIPWGWTFDVVSVTTTYFLVQRILYIGDWGSGYRWFAVDDPLVQIGTVTLEGQTLVSDCNLKSTTLRLGFTWGQAPPKFVTGGPVLIGYRTLSQVVSLLTYLTELNPSSAKIQIKGDNLCTIDILQLAIVIGDPSRLWVSQTDHFYNLNGRRDITYDYPPFLWNSPTRVLFFATNGIKQNLGNDFRYVQWLSSQTASHFVLYTGTWYYGSLYGLQSISFVYFKDESLDGEIYDPACAEVFSECDYQGQSMVICSQDSQTCTRKFYAGMRSLYVPPGWNFQIGVDVITTDLRNECFIPMTTTLLSFNVD